MICLTYDTDHMIEEWMAEFLARHDWPGRATFFCHRRYESLQQSRDEIGLHPYLNSFREIEKVVSRLRQEVDPGMVGVRSHSCATSHVVMETYHKLGFQYCSNHEFLYSTGIQPIRQPWGLWELPVYYMDNMDFWYQQVWPELGHKPFHPDVIRKAFDSDSLFVFAFHPLHVVLNTRSLKDYNSVRERIYAGKESPFDMAFPGRGSLTFFEELIDMANTKGEEFNSCRGALEAVVNRLQPTV